MAEKSSVNVSSAQLHLLAMGLMLCDHMWATIFSDQEWLTCVGRLAYPIFAFLAAEGFRRTHDLRRYLLRLLVWAVISEAPFNLRYGSSILYPFHQNVLWTLLLSLLLLTGMERLRARFQPVPAAGLCVGLALFGFVLGYAAMMDYYGIGVLTVMVFYLFPGRNWKERLAQLACLYVLNVVLLRGYYYEIPLFGRTFEVFQQSFALLALIPIWLYRGRQGAHSKWFRRFCYAFYPLHMLALYAACIWISR